MLNDRSLWIVVAVGQDAVVAAAQSPISVAEPAVGGSSDDGRRRTIGDSGRRRERTSLRCACVE